ncbi:MAG TPA: ORF6N domain-containing protein, partial [Puia sp.]|nr:ORF6N domain-containing protein [Puia sp.]
TMELQVIRQKIYEIRGQKVMLDFDLAELYGVETKVFNQAVKRNIDRFPEDFMFQLTEEEWRRSHFVTALKMTSEVTGSQLDENSSPFVMSSDGDRRSQNVTASEMGKFRNKKYLPFAFTEHGVSMLASVLRSEKAVQMSIAIVRAFIALKEYAVMREGLEQQIRIILDRLDGHDVQLSSIYSAIENLLNEKAEKKAEEQKWMDRERVVEADR